MSTLPQTASVVILNFNYGCFLGDAIESALGQTRPPAEVIVVDDGSTDQSRDVIRAYGSRVRAIFKQNGGMASAINAGGRAAHGDVIFLLDADDLLCPDAIETVAAQWREGTVMTQSRLALADKRGRRVRGTVPPPEIPLAEGDVRAALLRDGGYSVTLTSGLALLRRPLLAALPIPEDQFRGAADGYLVRAIPFHGPIQAVDRPLALHRQHEKSDANLGTSFGQIASALRKRIGFMDNELAAVEALAVQHGLERPLHLRRRNWDYLFLRLFSLAMESENHPTGNDTRLQLWMHIIRALPGAPLTSRRLAGASLATLLLVLPQRLRRALTAWWLVPETRPGWIARLGAWLRPPSARPQQDR